MASQERTKFGKLAGYGIGDFGLNIYWNLLSLYLVYWYTDVVGLDPKLAGYIFFIGMAWDAISDPLVAGYAERVRTRHGTYRPFILYGSAGLGLGSILLFWVPPFEGGMLIATLLIAAIIFRTSYTLVAVPYAAMSSRLSYDSVERTELSGARMFGAFAGLLLISMLLPPIARRFSDGADYTADGFQLTVVLGAVVATSALLICFYKTEERPVLKTGDEPMIRPNLIKRLVENKALLWLWVVIFFQSGANASLMISLVYFVDTNADIFARKEIVLTAFAVATMVGVAIWTLIIRRFGKKRSWICASLLVGTFGLHMWVFGPLILYGVPLQIVGMGLCTAAFAVLLWSFIPDTVEYGQIASGIRSEGVVFGSVLVMQKLTGGFMGVVVTQVLATIGYVAGGVEQGDSVGDGLVAFLAIAPASLLCLSILPILSLPLNRQIHADIVDSLVVAGKKRDVERDAK